MKKLSGHICDHCRTMFYPGDRIVELCEECARKVTTVWCVINVYEDDFRELTSIHHTEEGAKEFIENGKTLLELLNGTAKNKIVKQEMSNWIVL